MEKMQIDKTKISGWSSAGPNCAMEVPINADNEHSYKLNVIGNVGGVITPEHKLHVIDGNSDTSNKQPDDLKTSLSSKTGVGDGLRFNQGKLRYDLVHPQAHADMVDVLTYGATKYFDRNWEFGFSWSSVIASLKRHLAAIEAGEDYDIGEGGSGKLHVANLACNAHFLNAFYYDFPQGDDRPKKILKLPKIALDLDEVCFSFLGSYLKKYNLPIPNFWNFDRNMLKNFEDMKNNDELDEFYMNLEPLFDPKTIPFEPHCYITSRPVSTEISQKALDKYGFPIAPVHTVPCTVSKIEVALASGAEIFVDDKFENFKEINNQKGLTCYLYDHPHNQRYDVGHLRIKTLHDLPWFRK